jgi:hypothetical protein
LFRYAIKIIKKNFLQDKRKFQAQPSPQGMSSRKLMNGGSGTGGGGTVVSFLPAIVEDSKAVVDSPISTPPRRNGRSLRMKNKKFLKQESESTDSTVESESRIESSDVTATKILSPIQTELSTPVSSVNESSSSLVDDKTPASLVLSSLCTTPQSLQGTPPLPPPSLSPKHPEPPVSLLI